MQITPGNYSPFPKMEREDVWKVGTEWLRPMAGEPLWEFIERGGSYAAPLALLVLHHWLKRSSELEHPCLPRGG
jgi:hypothetical protein